MNNFDDMFKIHKKMIKSDYENIHNYLDFQQENHDLDKVNNKEIYEIYKQHFPKLKELEYGSEEYHAYEREHFKPAHKLHANNRHHYYSPLNNLTDIDIFDLLESIIDIRQSQNQYSQFNVESVMASIRKKGILNLDIESLVYHTLIKLGELDED